MFYGFVITEAGNRLLAKMVAGQTLELSGVIMEKGTADSADAARKLTAPIDPGPAGTSTVPTVKDSTATMTVEYRSDLNGGLAVGFWIGGFAIYARDPDTRENVMVYYGSLGDAKQYVSAYTQGMAPDVRRYQVSITVTAGVEVSLGYPAEAWMTAQDVAEYCTAAVMPQIYGQIAGEILTGRVYTPLADRTGEEIVTRDGAGISVYRRETENRQESSCGAETALLFQLVNDMRVDYTRRLQALTNAIMSGSLTTPLAGRNGAVITTRDSAEISAVKIL